jgi:RNA polymerase sigma factor, sigma-70 family
MDKQEFEAIYQTYYKKVFNYIKKKISNIQDSEELTHEIFIKLYRLRASYDSNKSAISTWIFVATNNRLKNYYRDRKEQVTFDEITYNAISEEFSPEVCYMLETQRKELIECLKKLSDRERTIIIRKYYMGERSNQIAIEMGLTPGNVRIIQKRSLEKLKKLLGEERG